jgi:hypothetical protein
MGFVDKLSQFGTGFAEGMEPGMRMGMQIGRERRINKQQQQTNKNAAENRILNLLPNNREGAYALLDKGIGSGIIDEDFRTVMDENVAGMDERASRQTMGKVSPSITRAGQATGPDQTVTGEGTTAFDVTTSAGITQAVTEATTDIRDLGTARASIEGRDFEDLSAGLKENMTDAEFRKLQAKTAEDEQVRRLAQLNRINPALSELMSENIGNSIAAREMIYDKLKGLYANLFKEGEGGEKTEQAMRKVKHMRRDYDETAFDEMYTEWDSGGRTVDGFLEIMTSPYSYTNRQLKFMLPEVMREATTKNQAEALVDINYIQSMMKSAAATSDPAMVTKASENLLKELKGNPNAQALIESSLPMYQQDAFKNKNNNKTANLKTVIDLYTSDEALANLRNTGQEVLGKFYGGKATGVGALAESFKDNMPDDLLKILKGPIPNIQDIHLDQLATVMTERQIKTGESPDSKAPTTTGLYSDEAIEERERAGKKYIADDASVIDAYFTMSSSPLKDYDLSEGAGVHLDDIAPFARDNLTAGIMAAYTDPRADKPVIETTLAKYGIELIIDSKGVSKLRAIEPVEPMLKEVPEPTTETTNPLPGVLPQ